jgi:hypothetical protein
MLQGVTLAHKGLAPSGLSSKFIMSKNLIIFTIQGTHSTYPKGGVSFSKDSFVVNQTLVFQIKFCGKSPALRVAANRWASFPLFLESY